MNRILKEPLLHFLLIGAVIFGAYGRLSGPGQEEPGRILVTRGQIEHLAVGFTRTWQRPPTAEELDGLVQDRVREEVYAREAIALGLDTDDTIIRRRLRQKMEFVSDDIAATAEPTDTDLHAYLQAHPETFLVEPRFTFSQVYLSPEKHGEDLGRDAARALEELQQAGGGAAASTLGDAFLLGDTFVSVPGSEVAKQFGEEFAAALGGLAPGHWQGPVASAYGVHLVQVGERTEARVPELAEVRDAVSREWANARRLEANEKFYRGLLGKYTVTIEPPVAAEKSLVEAKAE